MNTVGTAGANNGNTSLVYESAFDRFVSRIGQRASNQGASSASNHQHVHAMYRDRAQAFSQYHNNGV